MRAEAEKQKSAKSIYTQPVWPAGLQDCGLCRGRIGRKGCRQHISMHGIVLTANYTEHGRRLAPLFVEGGYFVLNILKREWLVVLDGCHLTLWHWIGEEGRQRGDGKEEKRTTLMTVSLVPEETTKS